MLADILSRASSNCQHWFYWLSGLKNWHYFLVKSWYSEVKRSKWSHLKWLTYHILSLLEQKKKNDKRFVRWPLYKGKYTYKQAVSDRSALLRNSHLIQCLHGQVFGDLGSYRVIQMLGHSHAIFSRFHLPIRHAFYIVPERRLSATDCANRIHLPLQHCWDTVIC